MGARGPVAKGTPDHGNAGFKRGVPKMPVGLSAEAQEIWQWVCRQVPKDRSSPADRIAILGLSKWFVQWDRLMDSLENDPADARLQRQAQAAWNLVDQCCRQMGFTLVSRARLPGGKAAEKTKSENPIAKILEMRRTPG